MLAYEAARAGLDIVEVGEVGALSGMRSVIDKTGALSDEELSGIMSGAMLLVGQGSDALEITDKTDYTVARETLLRRLRERSP
jgi:hypothetical protein